MNLVVLHKLGDLQAAGDAGSRAARIAEGLIADASTRIIYHQDESQIGAHARAARPLRDRGTAAHAADARAGAVAGGLALIRRPALPLAHRAAADQHRHRDATRCPLSCCHSGVWRSRWFCSHWPESGWIRAWRQGRALGEAERSHGARPPSRCRRGGSRRRPASGPAGARLPGSQAVARGAAPCAGRLRATAVGQVGRAGDPGAARVAGAGGGLVDQDRPAGSDAEAPAAARADARVRSVRALRRPRPHLVAAARGRELGRRARGRLAAGRGRRARPARSRGRRLLGDRRRAAAGAAAVRRGALRRRHRAGRGVGLRPGATRARRGARRLLAACRQRPGAPRRARRVRGGAGPSRRRPTARAARSRRPRRRCCGPTGSRAWPARRTAARSPPSGCWLERDAVPDRRRQGLEAAAADLPGAALRGRRRRLRAGQRAAAGASSGRC